MVSCVHRHGGRVMCSLLWIGWGCTHHFEWGGGVWGTCSLLGGDNGWDGCGPVLYPPRLFHMESMEWGADCRNSRWIPYGINC